MYLKVKTRELFQNSGVSYQNPIPVDGVGESKSWESSYILRFGRITFSYFQFTCLEGIGYYYSHNKTNNT